MISKEQINSLKRKYSILRGDYPQPNRGRNIKVNGQEIYVRTDFGILIEAIGTVCGGNHTVFNEIWDIYKSIEGENHVKRLFEAVRIHETVPYSIVFEKFENSKRSHENHYRNHGIIRGESGIQGDIGIIQGV